MASHDEDDLQYFLQLGDGISKETIQRWPDAFKLIGRTHRVFRDLVKATPPKAPPMPLVLALQGHASYLGAVRAALAGHVAAVYPGLRALIESALYALLMVKNPKLVDVWLHRHESERAKKDCREAFTYSKSLANLKLCDTDFALRIDYAYTATIDMGAHPNVRAVVPHITFKEVDQRTELSFAYLYGADAHETRRALLACF
jgi:hypothetical protein